MSGRKMKSKRAFEIVLTVLLAATFVAPAIVSVTVPCPPPTSLEVWKEVSATKCWVCGTWWEVTVSGTIYIQNDPWNPAYILQVVDIVEGKWKNNPWTNLHTETLVEPDDSLVIPPGETEEIPFSFSFHLFDEEYMTYKAYRNVVKVHLENHPTGDRWYTHRVSFEIP